MFTIYYNFVNLRAASKYVVTVKAITDKLDYSSSSGIQRITESISEVRVTTMPPELEKPNVTNVTTHNATVTWEKKNSSYQGKVYYSVKYRIQTLGGTFDEDDTKEITTTSSEIVLKDLAANTTYRIQVRMKTDFTYFAQYGVGDYSDAKTVTTNEIERTFKNELCDRLGINDLIKSKNGKKVDYYFFHL